MNQPNNPRPLGKLNALSKAHPNAWRNVEVMLTDKGVDLPSWPEWCFMPIAAWIAIASQGGLVTLEHAEEAGKLAAIGAWRYSQGIYRFDERVLKALLETVPSGDIPADVLYALPEWSVYIETPGVEYLKSCLHGFWVHLEYDVNNASHELRLLLDCDHGLIAVPIHIGKWTITEAVDRSLSVAVANMEKVGISHELPGADVLASPIYGLVSLVLYLCSDEPEIEDFPSKGLARPQLKKTKKGFRLFVPDKPRVWVVGKEAGQRMGSCVFRRR